MTLGLLVVSFLAMLFVATPVAAGADPDSCNPPQVDPTNGLVLSEWTESPNIVRQETLNGVQIIKYYSGSLLVFQLETRDSVSSWKKIQAIRFDRGSLARYDFAKKVGDNLFYGSIYLFLCNDALVINNEWAQ